MCLLCTSFSPPGKKVKILALGDSITQGGKRDQKEYTYRLPLQIILHREKIDFDFVGSQQKGLHEDATWPDVASGIPFDPDHDGYYGNKTRMACEKAIKGYDTYQVPPDIVLIHLGTNDQKHGDFENTIAAPLKDFITFIRGKNPQVLVLLGHLNFNGGEALKIREVVEKLAKTMNTKKSPVKTVHHYKGWIEKPEEIYTDTFDWAHPNLKGQEKMALNWWQAMEPYIAR